MKQLLIDISTVLCCIAAVVLGGLLSGALVASGEWLAGGAFLVALLWSVTIVIKDNLQ